MVHVPRPESAAGTAPGDSRRAKRSLTIALCCGVVSPLLFGAVTVLIRSALTRGSDPLALVTVRTSSAAVVAHLFLALVVSRGDRAPVVRGIGWRTTAAGIVGLAIGPLAAYVALERVDAVAYNCIYYLQVPLLALIIPGPSYRSGRLEAGFWALICLAGVALATGLATSPMELGSQPMGLALSFISMGSSLVFAVFLHAKGTEVRPTQLNATFMTHAATFFVVVLLVTSGPGSIDLFVIVMGLIIGVLAWLPARILWTYAVRDAGASVASALGALQPAFTALLSVLVLGEDLGAVRWIGVILICVTVSILSLRVGEALPVYSKGGET